MLEVVIRARAGWSRLCCWIGDEGPNTVEVEAVIPVGDDGVVGERGERGETRVEGGLAG